MPSYQATPWCRRDPGPIPSHFLTNTTSAPSSKWATLLDSDEEESCLLLCNTFGRRSRTRHDYLRSLTACLASLSMVF